MNRPATKEPSGETRGVPESGVVPASETKGDLPAEPTRPREWRERKEEVLTHGSPSHAQSIARAVVLKDEGVFLVTQDDGSIPLQGDHGYGLYYRDCRFLNGYELDIEGAAPEVLASTTRSRYEGIIELTNPDLCTLGGHHLRRNLIGIRRERHVDGMSCTVHDVLHIRNYSNVVVEIELGIAFRAEFEDVFVVRGLVTGTQGQVRAPSWERNELYLAYDGQDGLVRTTTIRFSQPPDHDGGASVRFRVRLPEGGSETLGLVMGLSVSPGETRSTALTVDVDEVERRLQQETSALRARAARIDTDSLLVNQVLDRSFADLLLLRTSLDDHSYYAAGVPWFVTLFGRDSLISALEELPYNTRISEDTIELLARYQGRDDNPWRDEQPGKILHELRVGELATLNQIPHTPYYGSVDATALFLILLARHAKWTGCLDVFRQLRPNVLAALDWISTYGERSGIDGYVAYQSDTRSGLVNQGWKDSGDAIVDERGCIVQPPVALVEVQAYTYLAKTSIAEIFERAGEATRGAQLRREAAELKERFNRDFWLPDRGYYALALTGSGPARVRSSNPGHALWAGIADEDKARKTAEMLMSDGMFSGWGVRTLADDERGYNPISYHRGTVWPHDNALLAAGLRRYGFHTEACRIFEGILSAAMHFSRYRLPEVWSGFPRADYGVPVRYPVACHPQAWAAGSIPYMLAVLLGFEVDGFERRVHVTRPLLPLPLRSVELRGLAVADGYADLAFRRTGTGHIDVEVLGTQGDVEVIVQNAEDPGAHEVPS
ncbi:glycogen debranching N-terminal domain-containing protein [Polyangium sp. y55x31]|uniref:amylo-alpha-1,6-glucosidase n=1 Tax=Polyangium sp. y55x31 TaxID=3042688 RepID=UPI002482DD47|nr:glycogen debranching N-terminal domain-containing protein [Polyangium sp. y55x31]MDI1480277.1 glycogen debranching N-terminal domain-containing protein [Polyangium sp. y55x31]